MSPLDQLPGLALGLLFLFRIGPDASDCSRVNQEFGPVESHEPRCFRIPLVPAYEYSEISHGCVDRPESEVPGSEIEFLIETRIVRNVHLAVFSGNGAVLFNDYRSIVIQPGSTSFKKREHKDDSELACKCTEPLG